MALIARRVVAGVHRLVGRARDVVQRRAVRRSLGGDGVGDRLTLLADRADRHELDDVGVRPAEVGAEHPQADVVGVLELVEGADRGLLGEVEAGAPAVDELAHRPRDVEHEQDPGLLAQLGPRVEDADEHVRRRHLELGRRLGRVDAVLGARSGRPAAPSRCSAGTRTPAPARWFSGSCTNSSNAAAAALSSASTHSVSRTMNGLSENSVPSSG